jgi:hypothetical protein
MTVAASSAGRARFETSALHPRDVVSAAARVRAAAESSGDARRTAAALSRAFSLWRDRGYPLCRTASAEIAARAGFSVALVDNSLDALMRPFTADALEPIAARVQKAGCATGPSVIGFIIAGNVAGAGIHEVAIALIAGAGLVVKTATAEPFFFDAFVRTLAEIDSTVASRAAVLNWGRSRTDLSAELLANCDRVLAYGDDSTIASLHESNKVLGFGSRVSAAVVAPSALSFSRIGKVAESLARDVVMFEQLGCLSPHQIFVVSPAAGAAGEFATAIARALERLSVSMPPASLALRDACEIRGVRERARWRRIAGEPIESFEGPDLGWTVVCDSGLGVDLSLAVSPGFRTVTVTAARDFDEVRRTIAAASRWIEAIAVAGDDAETAALAAILRQVGVPYICAPGEMQSPQLDWRHGGRSLLDLMLART